MATYGRKPSIYSFLAKTFSVAYSWMLRVDVAQSLVQQTYHSPAQASTGKQQLSGAEAGGWLQHNTPIPLQEGWPDLITDT